MDNRLDNVDNRSQYSSETWEEHIYSDKWHSFLQGFVVNEVLEVGTWE